MQITLSLHIRSNTNEWFNNNDEGQFACPDRTRHKHKKQPDQKARLSACGDVRLIDQCRTVWFQ